MSEKDPLGIEQHQPGAKLDLGKVRMDLVLDFGHALKEVGKVATFGATKYTDGGWLKVGDGEKRYTAALLRHIIEERFDKMDEETGLPHAAHVAWNALARLELQLRKEMENK